MTVAHSLLSDKQSDREKGSIRIPIKISLLHEGSSLLKGSRPLRAGWVLQNLCTPGIVHCCWNLWYPVSMEVDNVVWFESALACMTSDAQALADSSYGSSWEGWARPLYYQVIFWMIGRIDGVIVVVMHCCTTITSDVCCIAGYWRRHRHNHETNCHYSIAFSLINVPDNLLINLFAQLGIQGYLRTVLKLGERNRMTLQILHPCISLRSPVRTYYAELRIV